MEEVKTRGGKGRGGVGKSEGERRGKGEGEGRGEVEDRGGSDGGASREHVRTREERKDRGRNG